MPAESRRRAVEFGIAMVLALLVCATAPAQDVQSNYMPGTDFAKYHTYKWVPIDGASHPNQIIEAQIKASVDSQLASKGFTKTDAETADLYVGYQVAVNHQQQWSGYGMGGGLRWGGMASATSTTINMGTLALDFYDPAAKQLIWTGKAAKSLDPSKNGAKNQKNLDKAVEKLLKTFPPKSHLET